MKSPAAITGYEGLAEVSRETFRDGYFFTGDLGKRDHDGLLYLVGRKKFFINKGGFKINPHEIEALLESHPKVEEVVAVGEPVTAFLARTPLIFRDHGRLSAIHVMNQSELVTQTEVEKTYHAMWMPGLHRLYLASSSGWQAGQERPPQTVLVDLTDVEDCDPQKLQALWHLENSQ